MPSEFEALYELSVSPLIEAYNGEAITYIPRGRPDGIEGCGVWLPDEFLTTAPDQRGRTAEANGELWIRKGFFAVNEIDPKEGCEVVINGKRYASLGKIRDGGEDWYVLMLCHKQFEEKSDGGGRSRSSRR